MFVDAPECASELSSEIHGSDLLAGIGWPVPSRPGQGHKTPTSPQHENHSPGREAMDEGQAGEAKGKVGPKASLLRRDLDGLRMIKDWRCFGDVM